MARFAGQNVLVVGAGKTGLASARFLAARGARVTLSDSRPAAEIPDRGDFPVVGQSAADAEGYDLLVQSPGVPLEIPLFAHARERGTAILGELELAAPELKGRTIGITGSNGKTTTTALIGHILETAKWQVQVGGNIGTPFTDLAPASTDDGWNVLELSSFQLETVSSFHSYISLVLNITPDHLDRHGTMERYIDAKARIVETQTADDFAILNAQEPNSRSLARRTNAKVIWFHMPMPGPGGVAAHNGFLWIGSGALMPIADIPLPGQHNVENVMAAAAAAWIAGVPALTIAAAVKTFPGVEHRIEFTRELDGVRYYNDSKATNVDAAEKAINAFPGNLWIILGGKDKNSDYRPLVPLLETKAKGVLLIGAAAPIIRRQFSEVSSSLPLIDCGTLDAAIRTARSDADAGDIVLLSPACASFDQFQNYEHRGRTFKAIVQSL